MRKSYLNRMARSALIISIISIFIALSGVHITSYNKVTYETVPIDYTGWGMVGCPDASCVNVRGGIDEEHIYCNVPVTKCPHGDFSVEGYSICYDYWNYRSTTYLVFNANHNFGFANSCQVPVYHKRLTLKRVGK